MKKHFVVLFLWLLFISPSIVFAGPAIFGLGKVTESELDCTNSPTDNYLLSYDSTTGTFTWVLGTGDLLADGAVPLSANWDVGAYSITGLSFISDVATGTAPFTVASTTVVSNLNVSFLEGHAASYFQTAITESGHLSSALSDETGTQYVVFSDAPTFTTSIGIGDATLNEAELEVIDGATLTTTELNYVDSVTSVALTEAGVFNHAGSGQATMFQRLQGTLATLADSDFLHLTIETQIGSY